ncbi:suppressor of ty, putative [Entamoeba invadens IP1]|uniref:Suppressor of ty, putative n=1 Tax=Entamoeba invadens IP1 TaxID=370355 RepID=A0A0A1UC49_ENTIV|nr:suppressor of ty, putative [Entamoeba invadens IP1]ELP92703.1 suppressor of ty, putative [Entamoeba invadens IP1]|eukprot:XP_004259474.1 suppressor of ty, putative [Entamoeba invadens IP1]
MKRSLDKSEEKRSDESELEVDEDEEDHALTKEGYIADDGFIADDDEEEVGEEEEAEETPEEKQRRLEEKQKRKEEREKKRAEKEQKKKKRRIIHNESEDEEMENPENKMIEEVQVPEEEIDQQMEEDYSKCLEPMDLKRNERERQDKIVESVDVPEQLFRKKSVLNWFDQEGKEQPTMGEDVWQNKMLDESYWVCQRLQLEILMNVIDLDNLVKKVFELMYKERHDLMFIATYDKDVYYPFISENWRSIEHAKVIQLLWQIWDLDTEYYEICEKKEKVRKIIDECSTMGTEERAGYLITLDTLQDEIDFQLLSDEVSLKYSPNFFDPLKDASRGKRTYPEVCSKNVEELMKGYGITPKCFVDNLVNNYKQYVPNKCYEKPEDISRRLITSEMPKTQNVMNTARMRFATEFSHFKETRKLFYELALRDSTISTKPTEKGKEVIDVFNKYAIYKRLVGKPVSLLRERDDILKIFQAEKEGLITVELNMPTGIIEDACTKLIGSDDIDEWRSMKKETVEFAFKYYITPYVIEHLKETLRKNAVKCVVREAQINLKRRINGAPHFALGNKKRQIDETSPLVNYFVGGIVFGKESMMFVKCNADSGEFTESMYFERFVQQFDKYEEEIKNFFGEETLLIGVEAKTPKSIFMLTNLHKMNKIENVNVNKDLGIIYKTETVGEKSQLEYAGSSVCRQLINPMAEFVHICGKREKMLNVKIHPLQYALNEGERSTLVHKLQETLIEVVNLRGVDINKCIDHGHIEDVLSYVNGLGEIKANTFIRKMQGYQFHINSRKFLIEMYKDDNMENVVNNFVGFITISPKDSVKNLFLDQTRVHPMNYQLAENIVNDAYEGDLEKAEFCKKAMSMTREKYDSLDFDGYAELIKEGDKKMDVCLRDIVDELVDPFMYNQPSFAESTLTDREMFECVTNTSVDDFKACQLIEFVLRPGPRDKKRGFISDDLEVMVEDGNCLNGDEFGKLVTGKITTVDYSKCVINVKCNQPDVRDFSYLREEYEKLKSYEKYLEVTNEEINYRSSEEGRNIDYNNWVSSYRNFQIMSHSKAVTEVKKGKVGGWMVIPIAEDGLFQGKLMLVWKWTTEVLMNIPCYERKDDRGDMKIMMYKRPFDGLSHLEHYINKVNGLLEELRKHRRYHANDSKVDVDLSKQKAELPNAFHYSLSVSKTEFGKIRIASIPGSKTVSSLFVRLDDNGFHLGKTTYSSVELLVDEFKNRVQNMK